MSKEYVYVTKYALTEGIIRCEVLQRTDADWVSVRWPGGINGQCGFGKSSYRETEKEARAHADKLIAAKVKSLRKQIEKLEQMSGATVRVVDKAAAAE